MNWQLLGPLLITTLIAIGGWFVGHALTLRRDRANKKREQRISYLIEAYRSLASLANRQGTFDFKALESAIADIQLFGTPNQVELVQKFARDYAANQTAELDELLQDLRRDLRAELTLETVPRGILHLRLSERKSMEQRR